MAVTTEKTVAIDNEAHEFTRAQELEWIDAAATGDETAFEALYATYYPRVIGVIASKLRNEGNSQIEELAQDVMMKVLVGALGRVHERGGFSYGIERYFYGATANILKDTYRRKTLVKYSELLEHLPNDERYGHRQLTVEDKVVSQDYVEHIVGIMREHINSDYVDCLLAYASGQSYEEISQNQGITIPNVKQRLRRGRVALKKLHEAGKLNDVPADTTFGLRKQPS